MQLPQIAGWVPLRSSERPLPRDGKWLGPVDPSEPLMITIHVRPGVGTGLGPAAAADAVRFRESLLDRQAFGGENGADPTDLERVQEFVREAGLDIIEVSPARRSVVAWGTAAAIAGAFRVELAHYEYAGNVRRGHIGPVHLPPRVAHIVEEVSGLDDSLPEGITTGTSSRWISRVASLHVAIPLLAFLVGSVLSVSLLRTSLTQRSTAGRAGPATQSAGPRPVNEVPRKTASPTSPATHLDLRLAEIDSAAWKLLNAGRLRDAQDNFLRVLIVDPSRYTAVRGLVAVRRKMAADSPEIIRQQAAVYQDALRRGLRVDEHYTPSALRALVAASLMAAGELEARQQPPPAAAPNRAPGPSGPPPRPADDRGKIHGASAVPTTGADKSTLQTPVPPAKTADKRPVPTAQPQPAAPSAPAASRAAPPVPAPSAASNPVYVVRVGPLEDRDRATAVAKQLSARGLPQGQVNTVTWYRVVSEPLPRQAAEKLAATLAARGFRTSTVALTGDAIQLVFGSFASQKEAETLSGRVAAAGYDAWVRQTSVYTVRFGPYPQATAATVADSVRASVPDAAVVAEDASAQPSPASAAQPPALPPSPLSSPQAAAPQAVSSQPARPAPTKPGLPSSPALVMVRIGPVLDRDRAAAVAKRLSAEGFSQPLVTAHTGYRVVSEPLPRKVAEGLAATLAGRGLHGYAETLTGDSVQLVFGIFEAQKDAEALSGRVAAAGYDAWIREGSFYVVRLGPYPPASVNAITSIVRGETPEAVVTADPVNP